MKLRKHDRKMAAVLGKVRELSRKERRPDWSDDEWKKLMAAAVAQTIEGKEKRAGASRRAAYWKPALAYGGAALILVGVIGFALKDRILKRAAGPAPSPQVIVQKDALSAVPKAEAEASRDKEKRTEEPKVIGGIARPSEPYAAKPAAPSVIQARKAAAVAVRTQKAVATAGTATQDAVTVRLVSESGLQIVWVLDRNFEWKGERQ